MDQYTDLRIVDCNRLNSIQSRNGNNDNNALYTNDLGNEKLTNFVNTDNELFIYRFTDSYFPLKNLNKESNINLYNYYIFNRFYEEFELMNESEFSDEFYYYVKNTYLKTSFSDILKLIK